MEFPIIAKVSASKIGKNPVPSSEKSRYIIKTGTTIIEYLTQRINSFFEKNNKIIEIKER